MTKYQICYVDKQGIQDDAGNTFSNKLTESILILKIYFMH